MCDYALVYAEKKNDGEAPYSVSFTATQNGDVIVQLAGLWVDSPRVFTRLSSRVGPGREYELAYLRDGRVERTWVLVPDPADLRD